MSGYWDWNINKGKAGDVYSDNGWLYRIGSYDWSYFGLGDEMKINLTKLLDADIKVKRLIYSQDDYDTADVWWYVNRHEGTSPNQAYSFMIEDEE